MNTDTPGTHQAGPTGREAAQKLRKEFNGWRRAMRESPLPREKKLVAHTIADHYFFRDRCAKVGLRRIARECGFATRTVNKYVEELQELGWFTIEGGKGKRNRYDFGRDMTATLKRTEKEAAARPKPRFRGRRKTQEVSNKDSTVSAQELSNEDSTVPPRSVESGFDTLLSNGDSTPVSHLWMPHVPCSSPENYSLEGSSPSLRDARAPHPAEVIVAEIVPEADHPRRKKAPDAGPRQPAQPENGKLTTAGLLEVMAACYEAHRGQRPDWLKGDCVQLTALYRRKPDPDEILRRFQILLGHPDPWLRRQSLAYFATHFDAYTDTGGNHEHKRQRNRAQERLEANLRAREEVHRRRRERNQQAAGGNRRGDWGSAQR
jgi:hypothetical protein